MSTRRLERNPNRWIEWILPRLGKRLHVRNATVALAISCSLADGREAKICHVWNGSSKRFPWKIEFLLGAPEGLAAAGPRLTEQAREILATKLGDYLMGADPAHAFFDLEQPFDPTLAQRIVEAILAIAVAAGGPISLLRTPEPS